MHWEWYTIKEHAEDAVSSLQTNSSLYKTVLATEAGTTVTQYPAVICIPSLAEAPYGSDLH